MALDIYCEMKKGSIDDIGEKILNMSNKYKIDSPICNMLLSRFYENPILQYGEVILFKKELNQILSIYKKEIINDRKVYASNQSTLNEIIAGILAKDPISSKINELIEVCNEAIYLQKQIFSISD